MELSDFFERIELEISREISFPDKFRLALYDERDGLCYTIGEISKNLDFFIESANNLSFIQDGDWYNLDDLDIEKPFWGIEKISHYQAPPFGKFLHELHYFSPETEGNQ